MFKKIVSRVSTLSRFAAMLSPNKSHDASVFLSCSQALFDS